MKKLINSPEHVVNEALHGMAAAHADLIKVHYDPNFIYRADAPVKNKVAVISGGGSGHEPMHGGFVGRGMLDAACPGAVFTSPTPDQMLEATKNAERIVMYSQFERTRINELIDSGKWHSTRSMKALTQLVNRALRSTVSEDTVTRALDQIYAETRDRRFLRHRKLRTA